MKHMIPALGILALTGCLSVNPVTLLRLAALDPLTADPTGMAVQMDLPDGVGVTDGSAFVRLQAETEGGAQFDEVFALVASAQQVWRIDPNEQDRFRAAQARAAAWERAAPDATNGSFGASFSPCRLGEGPAEDAFVSINIQLEPEASFLPLLSEVPILSLVEEGDMEALRPCG
ncbi:hypothetical protein [Jannaschia sp. CCS1]|uniref:hypothetical protein n=1 Tax=Jannaschia sp. (strain CCS1) TaxID=290400 RepID=UPI000301D3F1|nr:hypothetical protein [Jannaschia sp. CCS1]